MAVYGPWKTATIANAGTTSDEVDLGLPYEFLNVILPTLTSGTLKLQVSDNPGGTFQDLGASVITQATAGGYSDTWLLGGWQHIKVVSSVSQGAERAIKVRGWRQ